MGITIVNQINEQECGVCVLTSLHNHLYPKESIEKQKVLDTCHISSSGMSIFDFEIAGNQLGIECESYEIKWSEFINLKLNSYFVLLLSTFEGNGNHYVIARKRGKYIEIYDSCSGNINKLSYSEIKNRFLNVVILISKKPNKTFNNKFTKARTLLMFDLKFVILNIVLNLFVLLVSVLGATLLNWVIDLAIGKNSINNLITISFIFVLVYFSNGILDYVLNLYSSSHLKTYFLLFTNKILYSLSNKNFSFLNKVDRNWIYKIDECVFNLANYCVIEINKLITNIIFSVIFICIIGIVQYYLLIFAFLIPVIQLIFFLISYRKKKEIFINIVRTENKNTQYYKQLVDSISNEQWESKKQSLISKIKNNYSSIYKNFNDSTVFKSNLTLFKSLIASLIEIIMIASVAYLIMKNNKITIGTLTFVCSAMALYKNSTNEIFNYFLAKVEFNVYWQVYKDITEVENLNNINIVNQGDEIKTISFNYDNNWIELKSNKDSILQISIFELLSQSREIQINKIKVDKSNKNVLEKMIVCDEYSKIDLEYFLKTFQERPELYSQYIRYFKIDLNSQSQSFYKSIIINLLSLIQEEKKIIFIDSILDMVPEKDKYVVKEIVNKIQKNNYVFVTRKEEYD